MLSDRQRLFLMWASLLPAERPANLRTHEQVAEKLGVTVGSLIRWENTPGFWQSLFETSLAQAGRRLPEILDSLVRKALSGSVPAIKLSLEVLGVHHDVLEQRVLREDDRLVIIMAPPSLPRPEPNATRPTPEPLTLEGSLTPPTPPAPAPPVTSDPDALDADAPDSPAALEERFVELLQSTAMLTRLTRPTLTEPTLISEKEMNMIETKIHCDSHACLRDAILAPCRRAGWRSPSILQNDPTALD